MFDIVWRRLCRLFGDVRWAVRLQFVRLRYVPGRMTHDAFVACVERTVLRLIAEGFTFADEDEFFCRLRALCEENATDV